MYFFPSSHIKSILLAFVLLKIFFNTATHRSVDRSRNTQKNVFFVWSKKIYPKKSCVHVPYSESMSCSNLTKVENHIELAANEHIILYTRKRENVVVFHEKRGAISELFISSGHSGAQNCSVRNKICYFPQRNVSRKSW
jgi:hypothetical protein